MKNVITICFAAFVVVLVVNFNNVVCYADETPVYIDANEQPTKTVRNAPTCYDTSALTIEGWYLLVQNSKYIPCPNQFVQDCEDSNNTISFENCLIDNSPMIYFRPKYNGEKTVLKSFDSSRTMIDLKRIEMYPICSGGFVSNYVYFVSNPLSKFNNVAGGNKYTCILVDPNGYHEISKLPLSEDEFFNYLDEDLIQDMGFEESIDDLSTSVYKLSNSIVASSSIVSFVVAGSSLVLAMVINKKQNNSRKEQS